jgi:alkaline phosphatase D
MKTFDNTDFLIHRRRFLTGAGAFAGLMLVEPGAAFAARPRFADNPFSLGVASGDPWADSVVLWTRLAPDPLNGGGMPAESVELRWEIAGDERMQKIVARGKTVARPELGHSIHVEVFGLQPARWYWYRFMAGDAVSPVGRTRTAPARAARVNRFKFAFASCQQFEIGHFTAYKHMIADDLDLVVFLGDYIYEGAGQLGRMRQHNGGEPKTLADYRNRHALYKTDPLLQQAHAAFPWVLTWDDHEVENNYASLWDENGQPPASFRQRRAAAYQAYYEHMPLRPSALQQGGVELYRRLNFGALIEVNVLDTRQYRSDQPCGDGTRALCDAALDLNTTMLGARQERWLFQGLSRSRARWNLLANQVMLAPVDNKLGPEKQYSMDKWSGYVQSRGRLLDLLHRRRPSNPIVITGDIHTNWVADLKTDFDKDNAPVVGTEFVGTSITSGGDGLDVQASTEARNAENPHIKFFNAQRGYVRCTVTPDRWQSDYQVLKAVTTPDSPISTRASFVVENGRPGAKRM